MKNLLTLNHNAGFFSCCSVALYDIITYINTHRAIPVVDFSRTFNWYKGSENARGDIYDEFFKFNKSQPIIIPKILKTNYRKCSHLNYKTENYLDIQSIMKKWFTPSDQVLSYVDIFSEKYKIEPQKTLGICYRGTDKIREIGETPYKTFTSEVRNILKNYDISRVYIQTDQQQFIDFFQKEYPDVPFFVIEDIPTTTTKQHLYKGTIKQNKTIHAQKFLSAVQILSKCKFILNHTGNTARWICQYRCPVYDMIQYMGEICYK